MHVGNVKGRIRNQGLTFHFESNEPAWGMCVATKASPGQRDFGWSEETGQSPRCNGRPATVKAGSLSYCLTAALEKGGIQRDCCLDQEQEEEENFTRGQGGRGPALQLIKATEERALRCFKMLLILCPTPLSPDLQ